MFLRSQVHQDQFQRDLWFRNFHITYCDFHGISRRSSIYILITLRKEHYLRNQIHLLVRRNEDQISIEKINDPTFPTLFYVKECLNYQMFSKAISISGKKLQLSEAHTRKTQSANMHTGQLFLFFSILKETHVGVLETVVSPIRQIKYYAAPRPMRTLRGQNGLASV